MRSLLSFALFGTGLGASLAACTDSEPDPLPTDPVTTVASVRVFVGASVMRTGAVVKASAKAYNANGDELNGPAIEWSSSAPGVATVAANGNVGAFSAGTTIITAAAAGKSDTATVTVGGDVSVNIHTPTADAFFGDSVVLQLFVWSKYQIVAMSAKVGSLTIPLDLSKFTGGGGSGESRGWKGTVRTLGLPSSSLPFSVAVTDVNGVSGEATVVLKHDLPPVISILSPVDPYQVNTGGLQLKVNCADVEKTACVALDVFEGNEGYLLTSGTTSIDELIPFAKLEGYNNLIYRAKDAAGQFTRVHRLMPLIVDNPRLEVFATVPGLALDIRGSRIAYADTSNNRTVLRIRTIGGGETTVLDSSNVAVTYAYLSPVGVLFRQGPPGALSNETQLRDYRGTTENLDAYNVAATAGAFAAYKQRDINHTLVLRDLTTGISRTISSGVGTANVSQNGHVAYYKISDYQVYLDNAQVTSSTAFLHYPAVTDGTRVVYYRCSAPPPGPGSPRCSTTPSSVGEIVLLNGSQETVLTQYPARSGIPPENFRVVNGWAFYPKQDATGVSHLWSYSPVGVHKQIANFGSGSGPHAVGDNGEVAFSGGGQYYITRPPYATSTPAGTTGKMIWRDGRFYTLIGGTVFRVIE